MGENSLIMKIKTFLYGCVLLWCFFACKSTQKSIINKSVAFEDSRSLRGIMVFSNVGIDYFFPFKGNVTISRTNYKVLQYDSGFLIGKIDPAKRSNYIHFNADTLANKRNFPFTHIMPVTILFTQLNDTLDRNYSTVCLNFNDSLSCHVVEDRVRFIQKIIPL